MSMHNRNPNHAFNMESSAAKSKNMAKQEGTSEYFDWSELEIKEKKDMKSGIPLRTVLVYVLGFVGLSSALLILLYNVL